jgi:uncharacterized membrane protein YkoI
MRRFRSTFAVTCLALAVLLAGCGDEDPGASGADQAPSTTGQTTTSGATPGRPTTSSTAAAAEAAGVEAGVRALQTAARAVPQGKAFDLDDETRGGQRLWEVKVASGRRQFDLTVAADGSKVLDRREDPTPDDDVRKLGSVRVDAARALRLAARRQPGQVTDVDLDTTDAGTVVWEVDVRQADGARATVSIHARTGKVIERSAD